MHEREHTTLVVSFATTRVVLPICGALVPFAPMLAERLKKLRADRGWTQAELAKLAKVSQQLVAKIESGSVAETRKVPLIAAAFGLSVEQFLGTGNGDQEPRLSYHGVLLTRSGALLAAEWEKLDVRDRAEIEGIIFARVGERVRSARKPEKSASKP
jgi:transcriptional regulator with XRE-family HTH domain